MSEKLVSIGLFAFGISSLIGSKLGGYSTDRWGFQRTLVVGMLLHAAALVLLSVTAHAPSVVFATLMLWAFAAWSSGPTQQYHLITLAPEASGIVISLNTSVVQLAMAAGAGIGGIVVQQASLSMISWIGAAAVAVAAGTAAASVGLLRSRSSRRRSAEAAQLQEAGA
jgi:DHA1 family putative efflux transporter-like MFS transporter